MRSLQSSLIILTFIAGLASADIGGEEKPKLSINALSWLAGQRQGPHDDGLLEQTWLAPRSGTVTALVRSSEESATRFVEIIFWTSNFFFDVQRKKIGRPKTFFARPTKFLDVQKKFWTSKTFFGRPKYFFWASKKIV